MKAVRINFLWVFLDPLYGHRTGARNIYKNCHSGPYAG